MSALIAAAIIYTLVGAAHAAREMDYADEPTSPAEYYGQVLWCAVQGLCWPALWLMAAITGGYDE